MQKKLIFTPVVLAIATWNISVGAATIGFDYTPSGSRISASPFYAGTTPSAPLPGPIVSEYREVGVTFTGGVVLDYGAYGGPSDQRAESGNFLETAPNLLATTDYIPLADGRLLSGSIQADFEFDVSFVSTSIRNGENSGSFGIFAYNDGVLVNSRTIELDSFLSDDQDGTLSVSASSIDEVRIVSSQPDGSKNFGVDGFQYVPLANQDQLHSSFSLASSTASNSERDQQLAQQNFEQTFDAAFGIRDDGDVSPEEAAFFLYEQIDTGVSLWNIFQGRPFTPLPFIIIPCDAGLASFSNCGDASHFQIEASLFDVWEFDIAFFADGISSDLIGGTSIVSFLVDDYPTLAEITLLDTIDYDGRTRADFRVRALSDVTSSSVTAVPLPGSLSLLILGLFASGGLIFRSSPAIK